MSSIINKLAENADGICDHPISKYLYELVTFYVIWKIYQSSIQNQENSNLSQLAIGYRQTQVKEPVTLN